MPISWNEIRHNAIRFSRDWTGAKSERAEKQTFWNEFFQVFGVSRRAVASFEEPVKKISGDYGYIDLFWPGIVLVEPSFLNVVRSVCISLLNGSIIGHNFLEEFQLTA